MEQQNNITLKDLQNEVQ